LLLLINTENPYLTAEILTILYLLCSFDRIFTDSRLL
jgi:hypothetical protein